MLPGRASDAGPDSRPCPSCGSTRYAILADCMDCHSGPICDRCPGVEMIAPTEIQCADCATESQQYADIEPECDCRFTGDQADASDCRLHQIAARVRYADIEEWETQDVIF